ncbi:hypothetical protein [Flavobacterium faecale]|nr:hypothetical protein [Flavobacterium faecale]
MEVKVNTVGKLNSNDFDTKSGTFYSIKIDLVNNTNSPIHFWVMSCSWQDNFVFNTDTTYFYSLGCDSNYPIIMEILPRHKLTFNGIIHSNGYVNLNKKNDIKLGFVLINKKEYDILKMSDFRVLRFK